MRTGWFRVVEVGDIKIVDLTSVPEGFIDSGIAWSDVFGFIYHDTGRIIGGSPGRWQRSKIVSDRNLEEPSVVVLRL